MSDFVQHFSLFNFDKEKKVITKPIRLIELFSGIGAQAKALEILGVPFEHWKTCEWAVNSIKSYNAIHIKDFTDYSKDLTKEELIAYLDGNISTNYNEPCDVSKKNESWLRDVYNNCIATHNLMNIMKVKGVDLEIKDTDKYEYILTYSFPCQDLSLAGQRKGMATSQADGGTRSGLLWECERILDELENKPQILLMENVPEVIGSGNVEHFNKWLAKLESLGYSNYFEILNAKNYGIPQNRRRCFMVSLLGDYAYDFPLKIKLKYRLKDFLEKQVEEKYYLSEKMINYITATNEKWTGNNNNALINRATACTINTAPTQRRCDASNYVAEDLPEDFDLREYTFKNVNETLRNNTCEDGDFIDGYNRTIKKDITPTITTRVSAGNNMFVAIKVGNYGNGHHAKDVFDSEGVSPTITTGNHGSGQAIVERNDNHQNCVLIKENNNDGYKMAFDGDGVNIASRMEHQRGNVQKGSIQTLKAKMEIAVVLEEKCQQVANLNYYNHEQSNRVYGETGLAPTIRTGCDDAKGIKVAEQPNYKIGLQIRKLVPVETLKLMGFERKDEQAMRKVGLCDNAIYHCAGDSIVVTCLMGIFGTMLLSEEDIKRKVENYVDSIVGN